MATSSRRRLSFVDFAHPQVWHKLLEYTEVTISLTKLITDFTNQWAKICFLASSQLHQLVTEFRRKTEVEIRGKCQLGGMMYDLWESLLLESEIESQSLKKMACMMEKEICGPLTSFVNTKNLQLLINRNHRQDFTEILKHGHELTHDLQDEYSKKYNDKGVTPDFHLAHNQYLLELTGVNSLYSKYQYHILPQLLQGMEQSQLETIDTICQNIQLMASIIQDYHEQRHSSFASFVVTSTGTNPNEELENYICSMNESNDAASISPANVQFESFISPINNNNNNMSRSQPSSSHNNEQLIIYAAPVIQIQLTSRCKETIERLKEIKKEKSTLLAVINPPASKLPIKQREDQQQSDKKVLNQMSDSMKRKHRLRLIELEESVLLAQQDLLKSHRPLMSNIADNEHDTQKRTTKNIKGLWHDAVRALKPPSTTSGTRDDESSRSSFVRRISSRKKKHHYDREDDQAVIDPVYETLKVAAESRKRTLANYIQQRQLSLNKQTSLTSQGSSELDTQPSPRVPRYTNRIDNEMASSSSSQQQQQQQQQGSSSSGKQNSIVHFSPVVETYQLPMRYESYNYL